MLKWYLTPVPGKEILLESSKLSEEGFYSHIQCTWANEYKEWDGIGTYSEVHRFRSFTELKKSDVFRRAKQSNTDYAINVFLKPYGIECFFHHRR